MLVVYSDLKKITKKNAKMLREDFHCTDYVIDFTEEVTQDDVINLREQGIESYYRVKLYTEPDILFIEKEVNKALLLGFENFAFDLEPYPRKKGIPNSIWEKGNNYAEITGKNINTFLQGKFKKVILYPENLGGDKYAEYDLFVEQLKDLDLIFLMERTYNRWKPWELWYFYNRTKKHIKTLGLNSEVCLGIWPDSLYDLAYYPEWSKKIMTRLVPIGQYIQAIVVKTFFKNIFLYTERKISFFNDWYIKYLLS